MRNIYLIIEPFTLSEHLAPASILQIFMVKCRLFSKWMWNETKGHCIHQDLPTSLCLTTLLAYAKLETVKAWGYITHVVELALSGDDNIYINFINKEKWEKKQWWSTLKTTPLKYNFTEHDLTSETILYCDAIRHVTSLVKWWVHP